MEIFWRLSFLIFFFGLLAVSAGVRIRAFRRDRVRANQVEGNAIFNSLRFSALFFLLAMNITYVFSPEWVHFLLWPLALLWRIVGWGLALCLLGFGPWVIIRLGKNISPTEKPRLDAELVTGGPYRYIRHPLYTTGVLACTASFLLTGLWPYALLVLLIVPFLMIRVPKEEAALVAKFGEAYRDYQKRSWRILPGIY